MRLDEVLRDAYKAEINVRIESFWDAGWTIYFIDHEAKQRAWKAYESCISTKQLGQKLHSAILKMYPKSDYVGRIRFPIAFGNKPPKQALIG